MGSVKDLIVIKEPSDGLGEGIFVFSDRYSVFDYGEMPDKIDGKGSSLCLISAFFFEKIEESGIRTHYMGLLEDGKLKRF
ncbi:MAG: phosphoribosylaminoimidazolesuccinocarboxamide synthase, partial [Archaeoglobaceae archaeon]